MSDVVISVENISKEYRLGTVSHNTMKKDMESWWARMRGKEDPNALIDSTSNTSTHQRFNCTSRPLLGSSRHLFRRQTRRVPRHNFP
jgi:hypothetical protein